MTGLSLVDFYQKIGLVFTVAKINITHVAIRFEGTTYSLPAPARHHDVIRDIVKKTGARYVDVHDDDQGFIDSNGRYLDRHRALMVARAAGQVIDESKVRCEMLTSEDVW
jgi:hypothetical protein